MWILNCNLFVKQTNWILYIHLLLEHLLNRANLLTSETFTAYADIY